MKILKPLTGLLSLIVIHSAFAATLVTPTPLSTILQHLQSENYVVIRQIDLDGNIYKAYALSPQGNYTKLKINAQTGEIISPSSAAPTLSMLDVAQKVEGAGYTSISEIESSSNTYVVKAVNPQGEAVTLKVDSHSGIITQ